MRKLRFGRDISVRSVIYPMGRPFCFRGSANINVLPTLIIHQSTSLAELYKALEVHGCKPWLTNLLIVSHILGMLTVNIIYCIILLNYVNESQVNVRVVYTHVCSITTKFTRTVKGAEVPN